MRLDRVLLCVALVGAPALAQTLQCDVGQYKAAAGLKAEMHDGALQLAWDGERGEQLRASFHVELEDEAVRLAAENARPLPNPRIGGVLDGYFEFTLERSRVAQPFP